MSPWFKPSVGIEEYASAVYDLIDFLPRCPTEQIQSFQSEAQRREMENLRAVKRGLLLQLQVCHPELDLGSLSLAMPVDIQAGKEAGAPSDAVMFEL